MKFAFFETGLLHWAKWFAIIPTWKQKTDFNFFNAREIVRGVCIPHFPYSPVRHLDWFCILGVLIELLQAWGYREHSILLISLYLDKFPGVVCLFLNFWGISILSSIKVVLVHIPTNSRLLYIFPTFLFSHFLIFWFLHDKHSNWGKVKHPFGFYLYFPAG